MDQARSNLPLIAVFTALAWEGAAVRAVLRDVRREEQGVWRGQAGTREVLVIIGGIGPRRTRQTMERFAEVPFAGVLSVGCAGALIPGLEAGHLVLAPDVCMPSTQEEGPLRRFPVDAQWLAYARAAAQRAAIVSAEGSLFTSTKILFTPEEKAQQGRTTGTIAVEMESGLHAAFAAERGIPFLALRVILDSVNMAIPPVRHLTTPEGEVRPFKAVAHMVVHPHHLPALLALKRSRFAAAQVITRLCHAFFLALSDRRIAPYSQGIPC
jgi:adenosylhomocysteine nucleosidase